MTHTAPHHPQGARRHTTAWAAAAALAGLTLLGAMGPAHAAGVPGQGTWQTTLKGRDLDGNAANGFEAYYDTALNITWLADANYAETTFVYPPPRPGPILVFTGDMDWNAANTWVAKLNVNGITGWRLPKMVDTGTAGCNFAYSDTDCGYNVSTSTSEMAHLYYVTLGNKADFNTAGNVQNPFSMFNAGPFKNFSYFTALSGYWSDVENASNTNNAGYFRSYGGYQGYAPKSYEFGVWAVRTGDVTAPVPEPQSIALALAGLALAGVAARRRRHA